MECLICGGNNAPLTQSSRVEGVREASRQREDGLSDKLDENATQFPCHKNCVLTYCSKEHIRRLLRKRRAAELPDTALDTKRLRGSVRGEVPFCFREHCFFCGERCDVDRDRKNPNRWRKAFICRTGTEYGTKTGKDQILRQCRERGDEWGKEVESRVNSALSDLHAADARYNEDCY